MILVEVVVVVVVTAAAAAAVVPVAVVVVIAVVVVAVVAKVEVVTVVKGATSQVAGSPAVVENLSKQFTAIIHSQDSGGRPDRICMVTMRCEMLDDWEGWTTLSLDKPLHTHFTICFCQRSREALLPFSMYKQLTNVSVHASFCVFGCLFASFCFDCLFCICCLSLFAWIFLLSPYLSACL